jgi:catechol 2,3-dioxygenase-like lactoylglutathione lyase family enzyme
VKLAGLTWLGTRTGRFDEMVEFADRVLGLEPHSREAGTATFQLDDGSLFEIFALDAPGDGHAETVVVAGFHVSDVAAARAELEAAGVEVSEVFSSGPGSWVYFRAPDGNLYELNGPGAG